MSYRQSNTNRSYHKEDEHQQQRGCNGSYYSSSYGRDSGTAGTGNFLPPPPRYRGDDDEEHRGSRQRRWTASAAARDDDYYPLEVPPPASSDADAGAAGRADKRAAGAATGGRHTGHYHRGDDRSSYYDGYGSGGRASPPPPSRDYYYCRNNETGGSDDWCYDGSSYHHHQQRRYNYEQQHGSDAGAGGYCNYSQHETYSHYHEGEKERSDHSHQQHHRHYYGSSSSSYPNKRSSAAAAADDPPSRRSSLPPQPEAYYPAEKKRRAAGPEAATAVRDGSSDGDGQELHRPEPSGVMSTLLWNMLRDHRLSNIARASGSVKKYPDESNFIEPLFSLYSGKCDGDFGRKQWFLSTQLSFGAAPCRLAVVVRKTTYRQCRERSEEGEEVRLNEWLLGKCLELRVPHVVVDDRNEHCVNLVGLFSRRTASFKPGAIQGVIIRNVHPGWEKTLQHFVDDWSALSPSSVTTANNGSEVATPMGRGLDRGGGGGSAARTEAGPGIRRARSVVDESAVADDASSAASNHATTAGKKENIEAAAPFGAGGTAGRPIELLNRTEGIEDTHATAPRDGVLTPLPRGAEEELWSFLNAHRTGTFVPGTDPGFSFCLNPIWSLHSGSGGGLSRKTELIKKKLRFENMLIVLIEIRPENIDRSCSPKDAQSEIDFNRWTIQTCRDSGAPLVRLNDTDVNATRIQSLFSAVSRSYGIAWRPIQGVFVQRVKPEWQASFDCLLQQIRSPCSLNSRARGQGPNAPTRVGDQPASGVNDSSPDVHGDRVLLRQPAAAEATSRSKSIGTTQPMVTKVTDTTVVAAAAAAATDQNETTSSAEGPAAARRVSVSPIMDPPSSILRVSAKPTTLSEPNQSTLDEAQVDDSSDDDDSCSLDPDCFECVRV